jgi:hypothetical protein
MATEDLRDALIQLEEAMGIGEPIGAAQLPDGVRFFRVLTSLRDILCPQVGRFAGAADTKVGDLVAILADTIVTTVGKVPLPAATVAKYIVAIGFERFCVSPTALVEPSAAEKDSVSGSG